MHEEDIDKFAYLLIMALCVSAVVSMKIIIDQREIIAQQQTRIENFQNMVNSIPADLRDPQGRPCYDTRTKSARNN